MWVWLSVALSATLPPAVTVEWAGEVATLTVSPPIGQELALEAPARVALSWADRALNWEASGADLDFGLTLGGVRGQALEGSLEVSLCDKDDGTCTVRNYALAGQLSERRRGLALLDVKSAAPLSVTHAPGDDHEAQYRTDGAALAEAAFAAASMDGRRVLLDFGAVWCPPCNLLGAEVLHADPAPEELAAFHVVMIDVDDLRSNALKDRYQVGGYPTVVVAEPDGAEVSRTVGYPGRDGFLGWLSRVEDQGQPDSDWGAVDPASVDAVQAAEVAWELVRQRGGDPAPWIERAAEATDVVALHLARVSVEPTLEEATWLADNAPGTAIDWAHGASALAETEQGRAVLRRALEADLRGQTGQEASDLLYLLAETAHEDDASLLYGAAAAALRTSLSGDPELDRGHYTWLAVLMERSGDHTGSLTLLDEAIRRWPDEPTFHMAAARGLLRMERPDQALEAAEAGMKASWGDNLLRSATTACEALVALGELDGAKSLADRVLGEVPEPEGELNVRTPRYRERLASCTEVE